MALKQEILSEHSKRNMLRCAEIIGHDKSKFNVVLQMMYSDDIRAQQLSAAVYYHCLKANPKWLNGHLKRMMDKIENDITHDAVKRNFFRILQDAEIPEKHQGRIYNLGMTYLSDPKVVVAVRAFSMSTLYNICQSEPELGNELAMVIKEAMKCGKVAVTSRGKKILAKLNANN